MEADPLTVIDTTAQWNSAVCMDSTIALAKQWNYSQDSILYHGSGFWFQEVLQYFKQRDNFGMQRHEAISRPDRFMSETLLFGLLLFEIFLVAFLLKRGFKMISQYSRMSFLSVDRGVNSREPVQSNGFNQILWVLTLIVFSLMGHVLLNTQLGNLSYDLGSWLILRIFIFTFSYFILLNLLYRAIGIIFFTPAQTERWIANNKTVHFCYAMALTPVLIGAEIGAITNGRFIFWWTVGTLVLAKAWMFVKSFRIFSIEIGDFLYLILYLCALEIMPILLYYKGLFLL
jgi:hypothetical protein